MKKFAGILFVWSVIYSSSAFSETCTVRRQFAYDYTGSECLYWDEVMIGIRKLDPLTIRCAQIRVDCNGVNAADTLRKYPANVVFLKEPGEPNH